MDFESSFKKVFNELTNQDIKYLNRMVGDLLQGNHTNQRTDKEWETLQIDKDDFRQWRNSEWADMISNQRLINDNSSIKQKQMWLYTKLISDSDLGMMVADFSNNCNIESTNNFGVITRGIKLPIVQNGDDITAIIIAAFMNTLFESNLEFKNDDIIAITESLIARSFGNYVSVDDIAQYIIKTFGENATVGVLWPIYSRNRFGTILKGIARGAKHVVVQLHHGKDEVGNDIENPWTGVNIIDYYTEIVKNEGAEVTILQSNSACDIVPLAPNNIIVSTIHTRNEVSRDLANYVFWNSDKYKNINIVTLADIFTAETDEHGFNKDYGLLGSNKCGDELLKLFPTKESCKTVCDFIKHWVKLTYDKDVHVMVYGDGCFKDPACGIWEFADPISCPYHTGELLDESPNELKIKYIADTITTEDSEIRDLIREKKQHISNDKMLSQGTTPRRYYDLIASLCDLTSGSGDKGTPVVWIQNYFNNYSD